MNSPPESRFDVYFRALGAADAAAAVTVIGEALDRGESPQSLIRQVVVPAQRKVGEMWFRGAWTVADEHAATAVCEQVLRLLSGPRADPLTTRLILACAEGEWHTMPARLAGSLARTPDLDVVMLGGSIPAAQLQGHLRATSPAALLLSCTMATNLIGASRSIAAAHAEGVPVIVGGAAWGNGAHRARRLGADLRLEDPSDIGEALNGLAVHGQMAEIQPISPEALLMDAVSTNSLALALERQCAANPWMANMQAYQRDRSLEDLRWLARHAAAALACDDPSIVDDLLRWLLDLLTPRGVPAAAIVESCFFLADAVEHEAPNVADVLRFAVGRVRAPVRS